MDLVTAYIENLEKEKASESDNLIRLIWISPEIGNLFTFLLIKGSILLLYPLILVLLRFMPLNQIGQIISSGTKEILNWIKIKDMPDS